MNNNIEFDAILPAVRIGFARAMSEYGMTPKQFETKIASILEKQSNASALDYIKSLLGGAIGTGKALSLGLIGGGALIGGLSGIARSNIEQQIAGNANPEIASTSAKADAYEKMVNELKDNRAAMAPQGSVKQKKYQEAMR